MVPAEEQINDLSNMHPKPRQNQKRMPRQKLRQAPAVDDQALQSPREAVPAKEKANRQAETHPLAKKTEKSVGFGLSMIAPKGMTVISGTNQIAGTSEKVVQGIVATFTPIPQPRV